ncbi:tetraspanin-17-like [Littorina saxatilis]|uniref:Tetraspanin n=1 Tax=Littorina saxatilis TaxID=31220 RepID=A0AAN9GJJ8_9CAEN
MGGGTPHQQMAMGPVNGQQQQQQQRPRMSLRQRLRQKNRSEVGICTKYFLFFENFLMFLVGLGFMAIGTYILVLKEKTVQDPLDFFLDPACDMCLAGSLIFFLSFLGCMGALRENTCFLKIFYYTLTLFLLLEVAAAVCFFLFYYVKDVRNVLFPKDTFSKAIVHYRDDKDMQNLIDSIQKSLGCCGMSDTEKGYEDWNQNVYFNCSKENQSPEKCSVPPSCCKMSPGTVINLNCGANIYTFEQQGTRTPSDTSRIYTDGCLKSLGDWVNENSLVVGGGLLGVLLPQIFVVCLSRNLLDMIRAQKAKWNR